MFTEEHRSTGAPTSQQALMQAMKLYLMAPFFRPGVNYAGTKNLLSFRLF